MSDPDSDLDDMDRDTLLTEGRKMPDTPTGGQEVAEWPQFMRGCISYRNMLDAQLKDAPRTDREYDG
ncbi:MAG: hypothetical protein ACU0DK_03380 [Pseudooceanicola sp.]